MNAEKTPGIPAGGPTISEQLAAAGLQRFDLKLHLDGPSDFDSDQADDALLAIFGEWRLEEGEEIIDLADYSHVPEGPGVLLISKRLRRPSGEVPHQDGVGGHQ